MNKLKKSVLGICILFTMLLGILPETIQAGSRMTVTVGTTDNKVAGDEVTVRLVGSNNPGIVTFAMKVQYNPTYLSYTGTDYASAVTSSGGMPLASDVSDENGLRAVNVSCVMGQRYSADGLIATVKFRVNQAYTTMPVTVTSREVDDSNYNPVSVSIIVDPNAGLTTQTPTQSGSQTQTPTQSGSQTQTPTQSGSQTTYPGTQTSQTTNPSGSQDSMTSQMGPSQSGGSQTTQTPSQSQTSQTPSQPDGSQTTPNNPSGGSNTTNPGGSSGSSGGKKPADQTPKTGAFSLKYAFGGAVVLFLGISVVCIKVLGKKHP